MKLKSCMAIFIVFLFYTLAIADDVKTAQLSLQDCINIALKNQTDIVTSSNNVTIAQSRLTQSQSAYFPSVSIQNNTFRTGEQNGVLVRTTTGTALSASMNVFDGGLREENVIGSKYNVIQNKASLERTKQSVVFSVTSAYYEVLRAKHLATVSQANVDYNESLRNQIKLQADIGSAAKVDVLPVEAQLANAKVDLLNANNKVRTTTIQLQNTIGLYPQYGFDIKEMDSTPNPEIKSLDQYISTAVVKRPDILQAKASVGSTKASVNSAKIQLFPRPTITAEYQKSISGGFNDKSYQLMGNIVFDIFNGGANTATYREAKANYASAQERALQTDKDIKAQVEEAYLNLTSSKERVSAAELSLSASQQNYEAQKGRYSSGLAITLDLLNAEAQLVTAQNSEVQARYDYFIAVAQMNYALGIQGDINGNQ